MDDTGAKPGDVFHDGVSMSQRFEIKKLIRQRYNLMGEKDFSVRGPLQTCPVWRNMHVVAIILWS